MEDILYRAASYLLMIGLGASLKRAGVFQDRDFKVLAKIMLSITLPCAIIYNFSGIEFDLSLLALTGMGLGCGLIFVGVAAVECAVLKRKREIPFDMINLSGYNIGNFSMPFAQSFLGPMGVVAISLFDTGNAVICNGGSKAFAELVKRGREREKRPGQVFVSCAASIGRTMIRSVPFDTYVVMILLAAFHIPLPKLITVFAGNVSQANAFVAMLMIGVGFKLDVKGGGFVHVVRIILTRYAVTGVLLAVSYWGLPLPLEMRQVLVVALLSPVASANPAFTESLGEDFQLASTVNSISMLISIAGITAALVIML